MKNETDFLNDHLENNASIFAPGEGEVLAMGGNSITLKVTSDISNDQLGVYEIKLAPATIGAKLHYHRFMDETFIVRKGTLTIELTDGPVQAEEGAVVYVPRMTPHGFANQSADEVVINLIFNPGQRREGFFHGLKSILTEPVIDPAKYLKLYQKYDSFPVDVNNMLPVAQQAPAELSEETIDQD